MFKPAVSFSIIPNCRSIIVYVHWWKWWLMCATIAPNGISRRKSNIACTSGCSAPVGINSCGKSVTLIYRQFQGSIRRKRNMVAFLFYCVVQHERSREMNLTVGHSPLEFQVRTCDGCKRTCDDSRMINVDSQFAIVIQMCWKTNWACRYSLNIAASICDCSYNINFHKNKS